MKEELIQEIVKSLESCNDISLLDFIFRLVKLHQVPY